MQNQLQVFTNKKLGEIRTIEIDGQPWFVGKDVAAILGYTNYAKTLKDHVDDEDKLNNKSLSSLGQRGGWIINESGLYSLILSSKQPNAKAFKRWITSEVLPTIRKHGGYVTDETLERLSEKTEEAQIFFNALREERTNREVLQDYVKIISPKVRYHDIILQCEDAIPVSIIAKDYGMSAVAFNRLLHEVRIQYNIGKTWLLYKDYCNCGYTVTRTYPVSDKKTAIHTYWTQKGRKFIYDILKLYDILPEIEGGYIC
jgi:prophage antirepressor-like protein